jgi:hypothetical protein
MYCRDGTLTGYLPPLEWSGGYLVYKMGQMAIAELIEKHGEERFRDMLRRMRQMRSFERAFQRTYGQSPGRFDDQWREETCASATGRRWRSSITPTRFAKRSPTTAATRAR